MAANPPNNTGVTNQKSAGHAFPGRGYGINDVAWSESGGTPINI